VSEGTGPGLLPGGALSYAPIGLAGINRGPQRRRERRDTSCTRGRERSVQPRGDGIWLFEVMQMCV